jgi:hypothetical protein
MGTDPARRDAIVAKALFAAAFVLLMAGAWLFASGQRVLGAVLAGAALLDAAVGFVFLRRGSGAR